MRVFSNRIRAQFSSLVATVLLMCASSAFSQESSTAVNKLQPIVSPTRDSATPAITFRASHDSLIITSTRGNQSWMIRKSDISKSDGRLTFGTGLFATDSTLESSAPDESSVVLLRLNDISSVMTNRNGSIIEVLLFTKPADNPAARLRRGNLARGVSDILVDSAKFVRGSVIALGGTIEVAGEIDKTVFSIIGNIKLTGSALVRGNVVSLFGNVEVNDGARFYGEASGAMNGRRKFRILTSSQFGVDPVFSYDRVDGLTLGLSASYPNDRRQRWKLSTQLAYALASDRVRGNAQITYQLLKNKQLSVSLSGYRQLSHDDDDLTTRFENTVLALAFKEDLWDWYESTGGAFKLEWKSHSRWRIGIGYRNEQIEWLPTQVNLWALSGGSGGSHRFRENFSTIPEVYSSISSDDFSASAPQSKMSELFARIELPSSPMMKNYSESGFAGELWGDIGKIGISTGSAYSRIGGSMLRSQKLHRHVTGIVGFEGAIGSRNLPNYRIFSIGGFGTVPGYRLREYFGNSYYYFKTELRFSLKSKVAAVGLLADYARINLSQTPGSLFDLSDVGVRLYLFGLVHLTAAAPIGSENDRRVKFWLSLRHPF